jgi:hypothetical protein
MIMKSLEELQVLHAEQLATAGDLGIEVPEDLTLEFETAEVGRTTCDSLHALIVKFREGLDSKDENVQAAEEQPEQPQLPDTAAGRKIKKQRAKTADESASKPKKPAKAKKAEAAATETPAEVPEEESTVTETKVKKSTAKKPAAKKAAKSAKSAKPKAAKAAPTSANKAKKAATKTAAPKNPMPKAKKYGENAKIKVLVKSPPELEKKTKWAERLKKVIAANGKKVKDAGVPMLDLRTAEWRGVISIID